MGGGKGVGEEEGTVTVGEGGEGGEGVAGGRRTVGVGG